MNWRDRLVLLIAFLSAIVAAAFGASPPSFKYEPHVVTLHGILRTRVYPGPPNYQDVKKGDEAEHIWLVALPKPITVEGGSDPLELDEKETGVKEVQLVIYEDEKKLRTLVGRSVGFTGTLFHAHTGHHHLAVLMEVQRFEASK